MRASQLWPEMSTPPPGEGGGHLAGPPVCGSLLPPRGHCSPWATQASRRDHPTWTLGFPLSSTGPHPFHAGLDLPGFRAPVTGEQVWPPGLQLGSTLPPLFCLLLFPISRPAWDAPLRSHSPVLCWAFLLWGAPTSWLSFFRGPSVLVSVHLQPHGPQTRPIRTFQAPYKLSLWPIPGASGGGDPRASPGGERVQGRQARISIMVV